jgi:hypothetical protein
MGQRKYYMLYNTPLLTCYEYNNTPCKWDMKFVGDFSVETSFWISEQVCRKKPIVSERMMMNLFNLFVKIVKKNKH